MMSVDPNDPEVIESLKFLLVPKEEKIQTQSRPFDAKKNVFVADSKEGYIPVEIVDSDGKMNTVKKENGEQVKVKVEDCLQMNPPKYEKCDDMADLTYLNDATVLHNLRTRYVSWYIYTYSGLFCVTINPFRRLPVYTMKMVSYYRGKKKNEVPPHLYLVADNAYAAMMRDRENQSMLITGESGAGKTENTKKVIQYFAFVAVAVSGKKVSAEDANKPSLEDQIVSANPVLEAYGNAKTTRNNNSSRFGKFIRIHFTASYGIAGADIESYLLEKSRITYQMPVERNYHVFYYLCSKAFPDMVKNDLLLDHDPGLYNYINQGMLTIDKVDDEQEMRDMKKAFDILLFTEAQQLDLFKLTSAVMHWGNQKWKQKPREEQAETDGTEDIEKVAKLLGLELDSFIMGLLKPKIKVGKEFVNKGQNEQQVKNACAALSKAVYARCFNWLVERVNVTLDVKTVKRAYFIGVLDIAGFETFEENGFEQLCINFTNERLQQFFNNFMFVLEQEEYAKEGIVWEMMSFGADLQATIDLIDKPMGIFSMLEEECVVPKGTDTTYKEKLYAQHLGKHPSFGKPKPSKSKYEAHFDLHHYAGTVSYSVTGWLDKNKDPINEYVAGMFKTQNKNALLSYLFQDIGAEDTTQKGSKKGSQTISANHREQLNRLMKTLGATHPHFVRCIIPNEIKTGGVLDAHLVMHQLHCNGVLEGIRICRKGFPSRIIYVEFVLRYSILNPEASKNAKDAESAKKATQAILETVKMDPELYRIGITKVLFKAGVLGALEEHRDEAISRLLSMLQANVRCYLMKKNIQNLIEQKKAIGSLQRNVKAYLGLREWGWWTLMSYVKPLLQGAAREAERLAREAEERRLAEIREAEERRLAEERAAKAAQLEQHLEAIEKANAALESEKASLLSEVATLKDQSKNASQIIAGLENDKSKLEKTVADLSSQLSREQQSARDLKTSGDRTSSELAYAKKESEELRRRLAFAENEVRSRENQIHSCHDEIANLHNKIAELNKARKHLEDVIALTQEQLRQEQDRSAALENAKRRVEAMLDETEANLEKEKRDRVALDKAKRQLESVLRNSQAQIENTERINAELEALVKRRETEINNLSSELEEERANTSKANKSSKALQQRLIELEDEAQNERNSRSKFEKQRNDLARELEELNRELEESNNAKAILNESRKKCEFELNRLRRDLDDLNRQHEASFAQLRKKHEDAVSDMSSQIDALIKARNKLEKEKLSILSEADQARISTRHLDKDEIFQIEMQKQVALKHRFRKE